MQKPVVAELRGIKSLRAFNGFHTLMLGLKMLPMYFSETDSEFYNRIDEMGPEDQELLIRQALKHVYLQPEEVEALLSFCKDKNGVAYSPVNIKNLNPLEIVECIVAVCMEVAKIKIDLVSDDQKKNSLGPQLTPEPSLQSTQI